MKALPTDARYIQIEKIENGYIIVIPENTGVVIQKYQKSSIDGVFNFIRKIWGVKEIIPESQNKTTETIESMGIELKEKKTDAKKDSM